MTSSIPPLINDELVKKFKILVDIMLSLSKHEVSQLFIFTLQQAQGDTMASILNNIREAALHFFEIKDADHEQSYADCTGDPNIRPG